MTDWDDIVGRHGPGVYAAAWRILGHVADTEDVVQEVFLQAHQMQKAGPVHCWGGLLHRLATCRALDRLRQRRPTVPLDDLTPARGDGPEALAVARELADQLRQALAHLPPREGEVFCLRYFDDLSYEQIADTLGTTPGAVAVALHKARARLETLLQALAPGE